MNAHSHPESRKAGPFEAGVLYFFLGAQGAVLLYTLYLVIASIITSLGGRQFPLGSIYAQVFAIGYVVTIFGVSLWTHRMATHQSFKAPVFIRYTLAAAAAMSMQGRFWKWVSDHSIHHRNTEKSCRGVLSEADCDPHTTRDGFWHAFCGWLVKKGEGIDHSPWANAQQKIQQLEKQLASAKGASRKAIEKKIADVKDSLVNYKIAKFFDKTVVLWFVLSLLFPALACYAYERTWQSFVCGLFISGFGRVAAVNLATSLVNSYEHMTDFFGNYRHIKEWKKDDSNNNWIIALFNPEGFHWNDHAFPWAANHGILWYERMLDHSANIIWLMSKLGLAYDVRWATRKDLEDLKEKMQASRLRPASEVG